MTDKEWDIAVDEFVEGLSTEEIDKVCHDICDYLNENQ